MRHLILTTCVLGAGALGFVAFDRPAQAFPAPALDQARQPVIHVQDMEDTAVEEDLQPDIEAPGSGDGEMSAAPEESPKMEGEKEGDMENKMIEKDAE